MAALQFPYYTSSPIIVPGSRACYDFNHSLTQDLSGNGFNLSPAGTPRINAVDGIQARGTWGTTADYADSSTSIIADSDHVIMWALVFIPTQATYYFATRGVDGSGPGWSMFFGVGSDGSVFGQTVVQGVGYGSTSAAGVVNVGEWNLVGMIHQGQPGMEPNEVRGYGNCASMDTPVAPRILQANIPSVRLALRLLTG